MQNRLWICKWIYANRAELLSNVRRSFTGRDSLGAAWTTIILAWNAHLLWVCLCVCVYIFSCHMNTNAKVLFKQWITCLLVSTCIRESMCTCTHRADAIVKGLPGQSCWSIHGLSVIIGSPAGTIDVDVLWVQAKRSGLHHVRYISIQHSHTWCINTEIKHAFDKVRSISQESTE